MKPTKEPREVSGKHRHKFDLAGYEGCFGKMKNIRRGWKGAVQAFCKCGKAKP